MVRARVLAAWAQYLGSPGVASQAIAFHAVDWPSEQYIGGAVSKEGNFEQILSRPRRFSIGCGPSGLCGCVQPHSGCPWRARPPPTLPCLPCHPHPCPLSSPLTCPPACGQATAPPLPSRWAASTGAQLALLLPAGGALMAVVNAGDGGVTIQRRSLLLASHPHTHAGPAPRTRPAGRASTRERCTAGRRRRRRWAAC